MTSGSSRGLSASTREPFFFRSSTVVPIQCRCGARIPPGGTVFGVTAVSPSSQDLFRDQVFCSVRCIGAFCLESLEVLDLLDTPGSRAVVSDLHELHREVSNVLASTLGGLDLPVRSR